MDSPNGDILRDAFGNTYVGVDTLNYDDDSGGEEQATSHFDGESTPKMRIDKVAKLRKKMDNAVAREHYELAAKLRDEIARLERESDFGR